MSISVRGEANHALALLWPVGLAFATAKRLLHSGWTGTLETQMELETRTIADIARTDDAREGIAAFIAKRVPVFQGR